MSVKNITPIYPEDFLVLFFLTEFFLLTVLVFDFSPDNNAVTGEVLRFVPDFFLSSSI